ncbi:MAG: CtsR family transcriptional regulator [Syntrophomonadaceae bacterium]|nr:CtsR family transcriptional regulator [Syntrophomonadaceae bacterium]
MKKSLADKIEEYIKVLIDKSGAGEIIIQRIELAETFCCVPSQVSYVISTRFTANPGYKTESRKGGNGYVRIIRREERTKDDVYCKQEIEAYLNNLLELDILKEDEYQSFKFLIDRGTPPNLKIDEPHSKWGDLYKMIALFAERAKS